MCGAGAYSCDDGNWRMPDTMSSPWWVWSIVSGGHLVLHIRGKSASSSCWIGHWRFVLMWFHLLYFSISIFKHLKFWLNMNLDMSCIWLDHILGGAVCILIQVWLCEPYHLSGVVIPFIFNFNLLHYIFWLKVLFLATFLPTILSIFYSFSTFM